MEKVDLDQSEKKLRNMKEELAQLLADLNERII